MRGDKRPNRTRPSIRPVKRAQQWADDDRLTRMMRERRRTAGATNASACRHHGVGEMSAAHAVSLY